LRQNLVPQALFIHGDICDYSSLLAAMRGDVGVGINSHANAVPFDAIVHLAAFKAAGESMLMPQKYSANNIGGAVNILNAALEAGINNIVFSSSAAVYGEPEYLPIDEAHPKNPTNYYGWTKLTIERMLEWYGRLKGLRYACLRYFNAAGYDVRKRVTGMEQSPANLIPVIMEAAAGMRSEVQVFGSDYDTPDGTCVRDYIHVNDLASAHLAALEYLESGGAGLAVNLGSGQGISVLEVLQAARGISGKAIPTKAAPRRPGDPAKLTASAALAAQTLHWKAQFSDIETIVRTSWEVYAR
jgi:UDP-glucose 4-epimerase